MAANLEILCPCCESLIVVDRLTGEILLHQKKESKSRLSPDAAAAEGSGIYVSPHTAEEARVVLVPVPFEATTSYGGGTSAGPRAIFEASKQVDLYDRETGHPYEAGIAMLDEDPQVVQWNAEAKRIAPSVIAH